MTKRIVRPSIEELMVQFNLTDKDLMAWWKAHQDVSDFGVLTTRS